MTQLLYPNETHERANEIIARYPADRTRSALLPLLHLVQAEDGYITPNGIAFCAEQLGLTRAEVGSVATFYTMYKRRPTGDWLVSVCTNTMCDVLGGRQVYEMLSEYLDVGHDETTADGKITLEHAECLAACDYGPVLTVNYEFFDRVDVESALGVVTDLQAGKRPQPSRGARLCTLKEMSLQLAGFLTDEERETVGDNAQGDGTLRGNRLAEQHGISVGGFDPDSPIRPKSDNNNPARPAKKAESAAKAEVASTSAPANEAEAAGAAANEPASDRKPAGDAPKPQEAHLKEADK